MIYRFRRRWFLLVVTIFMLGLTFHHTSFQLPISPLSRIPYQYTSAGFDKNDYQVRDLMHFSKYKFSYSDEFETSVGSWDVFSSKSHTTKCEDLFSFISTKMPDWKASTMRNKLYNKHVVNKAGYFSDNQKRVIKQKHPRYDDNPDELTNEDRQELDLWYADTLNTTLNTEQEMADCMSIIRNFGHCFLGANAGKSEKLDTLFKEFAPKVLPYFTKEFPQVVGSVGSNSFFEGSRPFDASSEFIDYYSKNIHGAGIVISASTRHARDLVKLIHVLRALGNKLPIQVLFRRDLSSLAKGAIERAASAPKDKLFSTDHMELSTLRSSLRSLGLNDDSVREREFPQQDLTMIDMHNTLSSMARTEFSGYNNKIAALFFNSFERVILLDVDTVPLSPPEAFFETQEYIDNGAYFFKDRSLLDRNGWVETNYFAKLMPHESNKLDMAMGVKPVTNHTMRNEYMQGWRHCQEAGVVLLDRKAHFSSLLVLLTLSLWGEPSKSSVWGDKEFYWLAMSIAGDEKYAFNPNSAASIGEFTASKNMMQYNTTESMELCSSHPGHISSKGELLWINSGFSYCKMNGFSRDKSKFPFNLFERETVKDLYESPLKIRHAIVPPVTPALRAVNGPADQTSENLFVKSLKRRRKDVDDLTDVIQLGEYGPQKGWVKSPLCSNYQYCAYNQVNSLDGSGGTDMGQVFTFEPKVTRNFDILGSIWISAKRYADKSDKYKNKPKAKASTEKPSKPTDIDIDANANTANDVNAKVTDDINAFDPSKVRERPEKLNHDIMNVIAKWKQETTSNTASITGSTRMA